MEEKLMKIFSDLEKQERELAEQLAAVRGALQLARILMSNETPDTPNPENS